MPFEDPTISFNLANVYLSQKNFLEARDAYEEAIKLQNMNPKYWHHKGLVYEAMIQDLEEKHGPQLVKLKSVKSKKRLTKDPIFTLVQEYVTSALKIFTHITTTVSTHHFDSQYHLALLLHKTYNYNDSLKHFDRAVK